MLIKTHVDRNASKYIILGMYNQELMSHPAFGRLMSSWYNSHSLQQQQLIMSHTSSLWKCKIKYTIHVIYVYMYLYCPQSTLETKVV